MRASWSSRSFFPAVFMFGMAAGVPGGVACVPVNDPKVATIVSDVLDAAELACIFFHDEVEDVPLLEEACKIADTKKRSGVERALSARAKYKAMRKSAGQGQGQGQSSDCGKGS